MKGWWNQFRSLSINKSCPPSSHELSQVKRKYQVQYLVTIRKRDVLLGAYVDNVENTSPLWFVTKKNEVVQLLDFSKNEADGGQLDKWGSVCQMNLFVCLRKSREGAYYSMAFTRSFPI